MSWQTWNVGESQKNTHLTRIRNFKQNHISETERPNVNVFLLSDDIFFPYCRITIFHCRLITFWFPSIDPVLRISWKCQNWKRFRLSMQYYACHLFTYPKKGMKCKVQLITSTICMAAMLSHNLSLKPKQWIEPVFIISKWRTNALFQNVSVHCAHTSLLNINFYFIILFIIQNDAKVSFAKLNDCTMDIGHKPKR